MFRIDVASAVSTLPTPAAPGTPGYATNGNPATGSPPTIIDADWGNRIQEELMTFVLGASLTPSKTNYTQVAQAFISGTLTYAVDSSGTANTIVGTLPVTPAALSDGMEITIKVANANTGSTTININGLGAKTVQHKAANLVGGELAAGQSYTFIYNLSLTVWQLASIVGSVGNLFIGTASTGGSANAQTLAVSPAGYTLKVNNIISFNAGYSNSAATTLNVGGTGAITIKKKTATGLTDVVTGDIVAGDDYMVQYDGVYYELTGTEVPTFGSVATLNLDTTNFTSSGGYLAAGTGLLATIGGLSSSTAASTYAPLASPTFTGTPSLPTGTTVVTQTSSDSSTKPASTAFVQANKVITAKAVGSYALASQTTGTISAGGTIAGSSLTPYQFVFAGASSGVDSTGDSLSGTYQAETITQSGGGCIALWQRTL